jgi:hypothetical protein
LSTIGSTSACASVFVDGNQFVTEDSAASLVGQNADATTSGSTFELVIDRAVNFLAEGDDFGENFGGGGGTFLGDELGKRFRIARLKETSDFERVTNVVGQERFGDYVGVERETIVASISCALNGRIALVYGIKVSRFNEGQREDSFEAFGKRRRRHINVQLQFCW